MNEASLTVLRMVADGKLSAEQADELLNVLGDEIEPPAGGEQAEQPDMEPEVDSLTSRPR